MIGKIGTKKTLTWRYHYNRNTALYYGHSIRAGNSCRQRSCRQISGFCRRRQSSFQTFTGHTGLLLITLNVAGTVPATFTRHTPFVPARGKPCRDSPTFYFLGLTYHQENLIFAGTVVPWPSLLMHMYFVLMYPLVGEIDPRVDLRDLVL